MLQNLHQHRGKPGTFHVATKKVADMLNVRYHGGDPVRTPPAVGSKFEEVLRGLWWKGQVAVSGGLILAGDGQAGS